MVFSEQWQKDVDNSITALDNTDKSLLATLNMVDRKYSSQMEAQELRIAKLEREQEVPEIALPGNAGSFLKRVTRTKFLAALGGAITAIVGMIQGSVPADVGMYAIVAVIMTYIGAEGYADAQTRKKS